MVRSAPRINVSLLAVLTLADNTVAAAISNLSGNGMALLSEQPLGEVGETLNIAFTLPIIERSCHIETRGVIRNQSTLKAQKVYQYGVQLHELTPEQRVIVEALIYNKV